jgi:hypothetical protein
MVSVAAVNRSKSGKLARDGAKSGFQRIPIGIALSSTDSMGYSKIKLFDEWTEFNIPISKIKQGDMVYVDKNGYCTY